MERFSSGEERRGGGVDGEQCRNGDMKRERQREREGNKAEAKLVFQANPNRKCKRGTKRTAILKNESE